MAEITHAQFAPSALESMEACPGFRNRKNKTEASLRGDRVHAALQKDTLGELVNEERAIAQMCKDYIDAAMLERGRRPQYEYRELTVDIDLGAGITTFGTFDRLLIYDNEGDVYDYKS